MDRRLAEKRFFPAIEIDRSGTRREELLLDEVTLREVWQLRRLLTTFFNSDSRDSSGPTEQLLERMRKTKNNKEFLATWKDMAKEVVRSGK